MLGEKTCQQTKTAGSKQQVFFEKKHLLGGGGNSKIFLFSSLFGEDFQFDEHVFQMGWFNHQLDSLFAGVDFLGLF